MIINSEDVEKAVHRSDELPGLMKEARRKQGVAEFKAKAAYAVAFQMHNGTLKDKEMAARRDKDYEHWQLQAANYAGEMVALYAEKEAVAHKISIWQTESANNRKFL